MRSEINKILNLGRFFNITQSNNKSIQYKLEKPSSILMQNIYNNWLWFILSKTKKHFPVFLDRKNSLEKQTNVPFGFLNTNILEYDIKIFQHSLDEYGPKEKSILSFNLIVPKQDTTQSFIQWQRYRKFWWSSITTSPSLFSVGEIKHEDDTSSANITAKFPWGSEVVETLNLKSNHTIIPDTSHLCCTLELEKALFILLSDGLNNTTKEGYLRLHRKMAPYKISFALDAAAENTDTLKDLAKLLHLRLARNRISTLLPDFCLSTENQLQENVSMGVVYTAVLSESTLSNGIFHLLNSSTMLKEQVHIADFDNYAALICGK